MLLPLTSFLAYSHSCVAVFPAVVTLLSAYREASVSWPFICVLGEHGYVLSETHDAPVPYVLLRIFC